MLLDGGLAILQGGLAILGGGLMVPNGGLAILPRIIHDVLRVVNHRPGITPDDQHIAVDDLGHFCC